MVKREITKDITDKILSLLASDNTCLFFSIKLIPNQWAGLHPVVIQGPRLLLSYVSNIVNTMFTKFPRLSASSQKGKTVGPGVEV